MKIIFLDGQYLSVSPQIIEAFTPGYFKARGVFETMLGIDGFVMDADLHLNRLRSGLKILGIKPLSVNPLILKEVLARNPLSSARIRVMVWQAGKQIHVMIVALPYKILKEKKYRVCLVKTKRAANDLLANVKSLDYALNAEAFDKAQAQGCDDALLLNDQGHIFEASRANIFWVKDKVLYTPPLTSGCLNGITRQQVIKQAKLMKISVKEENLTPEILQKADSRFLTNSLMGIKAFEMKIS